MSKVNYEFFNNNPKGRITGDCAPRALSLFTGLSWEDIMRLSGDYYLETGKALFSPKGIFGIVDIDWVPKGYNASPFYAIRKRTIKEFIEKKAKEDYIYLIDTSDHLTVIKDKVLYDTWDCSDKEVVCGIRMPIRDWERLKKVHQDELYQKIKKNLTK